MPHDLGGSLDAVTAGVSHTCAIHLIITVNPGGRTESPAPDGILCWGDNHYGQLGDGTTLAHAPPAAVTGLTATPSSVGAGDGFTCATISDGRAACWGRNNGGQLGDGTTTDRTLPKSVASTVQFAAGVRIAVGAAHTCALDVNGLAYCWGENEHGELGDGTTISRSAPVPVSGGVKLKSITAGGAHTCGLTDSGVAYCWGDNADGQLGIGAVSGPVTVPTRVAGARAFSSISAGADHTCAVGATDLLAYCWGLNADGQLGTGSTSNAAQPAAVAAFVPVPH
jgi:alpha-tubulin suppressor-like RCC1 family protein